MNICRCKPHSGIIIRARSYGLDPIRYIVTSNLPCLLHRKPFLLNLPSSPIAFEFAPPLGPFTMGETPGKMYALATVLTLLAAVAVLLRLHARKIKKAILAWDDYMILFAMVSRVARGVHLLSCERQSDEVVSSCSPLVPQCVCSLVSTPPQRLYWLWANTEVQEPHLGI